MKQNVLGIQLSRKQVNLLCSPLQKRIGVLVSGGLDSAILYYLLLLYNKNNNNYFNIVPYTIDGSDNLYAKNVIDYVNTKFNFPSTDLNLLYDCPDDELGRIPTGQKLVLKKSNVVYCGHIQVQPEHSIGVTYRQNWTDSLTIKYPLKELDKSDIVELIIKFNCSEFFDITKSCIYNSTPCEKCNRCLEKNWAFLEYGKRRIDK